MIGLDLYVLLQLDFVYSFENGQAMAHTGHTYILEIGMLYSDQCFSVDCFI